MQQFLRDRYGIESNFIYHPFYLYPIQNGGNEEKTQAVSISRIDFYKNIEVILDANKRASNPIKIYGWANGKWQICIATVGY